MTGKPRKDDSSRESRLAEALRANLKRRKEGARRRAPQKPAAAPIEGQGTPE